MPSVLWCCWLGGRKGIWPVKTEWWGAGVVICWSEVQTCSCIWPSWCHWHSLSLASVKSRLILPFWYRLTWVVPEKGPLNGCVFLLCELWSHSTWCCLLSVCLSQVKSYTKMAKCRITQTAVGFFKFFNTKDFGKIRPGSFPVGAK